MKELPLSTSVNHQERPYFPDPYIFSKASDNFAPLSCLWTDGFLMSLSEQAEIIRLSWMESGEAPHGIHLASLKQELLYI